MSSEFPHRAHARGSHQSGHVRDLLPAYLGGALGALETQRVHMHLARCAACRAQLAGWQGIRSAVQAATEPVEVPSLALLEGVWQRVEAPAAPAVPALTATIRHPTGADYAGHGVVPYQWTRAHGLRHAWLVLVRQWALLPGRGLLAALVLFASDILALMVALRFAGSLPAAAATLAVITTLSATLGIAFAVNVAHDPGVEVTLATPTSLRALLFCRFFMVTGASTLLAGCASIVIALLYGQGVWGIVELWLGPMLLLSSLTLALVLLIGSWIAALPAFLLEAMQLLRLSRDGQILPLEHPHLWQTNPAILLLAAVCLAVVFVYAPRHVRFSQSAGEH
jgi:anti-sigma factor RsiW